MRRAFSRSWTSSPGRRVPNPAYAKGYAGEANARAHLERCGFFVIRAYMSKGPWDLLALAPDTAPLFIQVKAGGTFYMRPSDRAALLAVAHRAGGRALLCHVPHPYSSTHDGIDYVELTSMADRVAFEPSIFAAQHYRLW